MPLFDIFSSLDSGHPITRNHEVSDPIHIQSYYFSLSVVLAPVVSEVYSIGVHHLIYGIVTHVLLTCFVGF